jgi:hypothetical protein
MSEDAKKPTSTDGQEEVKADLINRLNSILEKVSVEKIYFVDDAINLTTDKNTFIGLVEKIVSAGNISQLREINIQNGINFSIEEEVLSDHIGEVWDGIKPGKQFNYYKKIYAIAGEPEAINDLNVANNLKEYFPGDIFEALTPQQWDEKRDQILQSINANKRILVLFDQDLRLAPGRFSNQNVKGETLITELLESPVHHQVIKALFTHTITDCDAELTERNDICTRVHALTPDIFFVLAKARLEKNEMFADGIKKTCLNTFCEDIKSKTIGILEEAQKRTITRLRGFDTYDFDHTVFKSSGAEGVWEPETLLRITDIIFRDEVRQLMIDKNYVPDVNQSICDASEISRVNFEIDDTSSTYSEKLKLRNQEIYEKESLLNNLRRPIDNGDIFLITDGDLKGRKFILVAQECDLMVRGGESDKGKRGTKVANLLPIEVLTYDGLIAAMKRKYSSDIEKSRFLTHFYAEKFKLEYFENGTTKVGIVDLSKAINVDLNVLDLIVFNETGEAVLDLNEPTFNKAFHNSAWKSRYEIISKEFQEEATKLNELYAAISKIDDQTVELKLQAKINRLLTFIVSVGVQINYHENKFAFGLKRISRLRMPKSKYLMDRYYQYLSREAEPHDFVFLEQKPVGVRPSLLTVKGNQVDESSTEKARGNKK